jgi:arsenate reductase (thioredoxin)
MSAKKTIYFLCTGNSCRSQMAEGFAKKYLGEEYDIYSAGIEAHGMNPQAVQTMLEKGIDISEQTSDTIDHDLLRRANHVITLCGHANEVCPAAPPHVKRDHWGFDDPAKAEGTAEQRQQMFRRVRDEIDARIRRFAESGE